MDRCAGCGFEYRLDDAPLAAARIGAGADALAALLEGPGDLRTRRAPGTWSPLEYGCHVRDVLLVQRERVFTARLLDTPSFDPMGREERVAYDGYGEQQPPAVARQLRDAAAMFGNVLAHLGPEDWDRTVMYNYPALFERSLQWVAVHTVHEVQHHLLDVRGQLS